ncbi:protein-disulfide reductase DsbD [Pseudoduganella aquatica]|uniref:Thiol:disulfide interchange protein DsbD n=1 Tax=Pseudoduganella aquatica TaxID=2660641 RepID=A0A7X4KMF2_9BURK|nr:protein-disulfide reductase DsbD [Pseudoduganella aquatica]MYN07046.1 protein-disulfide reductase DsbD [Pseudoduganella aquatica]
MFRFAHHLVRLLLPLTLLTLLFSGPARAEEDFLDPAVAFKFSARMLDAKTASVTYEIADGYYMYRERFAFKAQGATLGKPDIPPGKVKFDETFNKEVETYRKHITITIPVDTAGPFTLTATSQGCSDKGLCYSPQDAQASLIGSGGSGAAPAADVAAASPQGAASGTGAASELGKIEAALKGGRLLVILPLFALLGLGLAFTPCVLPMVPILSSIIVGEGQHSSRSRGLLLSLTYALGMAIVYTALGVAAGLIGEGLAAALQNPWVLGAFGLLMVGLSLSMFGVYELQVPAGLQSRLSTVSNRQSSGKLAGVFAMGAISALIVGPCVAAPLAGALVYISQTRDVVVGGGALFAMAVGMSVPLVLVGVSAGTLLPRAGAWMDNVKQFFGVLLLAMALWLVSPVLPAALAMVGFALLGIGYGVYLLSRTGRSRGMNWGSAGYGWLAKAVAAVFILLGGVQLVGLATGGRDVLAPLAHLTGGAQAVHFTRVKTVAQLDAALAQTGGKTAILDFYADWCVSCKEMEKLTFIEPAVKARLANTVLLQVDVTANDEDDKALLKRFKLFGPPGIILFNAQGQEIPDSRVVGFQNAETFLKSLDKLQ